MTASDVLLAVIPAAVVVGGILMAVWLLRRHDRRHEHERPHPEDAAALSRAVAELLNAVKEIRGFGFGASLHLGGEDSVKDKVLDMRETFERCAAAPMEILLEFDLSFIHPSKLTRSELRRASMWLTMLRHSMYSMLLDLEYTNRDARTIIASATRWAQRIKDDRDEAEKALVRLAEVLRSQRTTEGDS